MKDKISFYFEEFAKCLDPIFGSRLIDIVFYGSLVRGGFDLLRSDIDFIVWIDGPLTPQEIRRIIELHQRLRLTPSAISKLEGRYLGISDYKVLNGYYVGTNELGWKALDCANFNQLESAMILDCYDSYFHRIPLAYFLPFSWNEVYKDIQDQINTFLNMSLLEENIAFQKYAIEASVRSLYTVIHQGFLSKQEALSWYQIEYGTTNHLSPRQWITMIQEQMKPHLEMQEVAIDAHMGL
ncbi:MAG: nucleotidyltransferase domain-containing protein [Candidatus Izemoplasmatales bacterium]|nr:nucleotidyltransferase domain-containing protein [Candidatus Izemoplasmatales bacterium]